MNTITILTVAVLVGTIGFYETRIRKLREEINARKLEIDLRFLTVLLYMQASLGETTPNLDEYEFEEAEEPVPDHLEKIYAMWHAIRTLKKEFSQ